jgi:hypothetical protein
MAQLTVTKELVNHTLARLDESTKLMKEVCNPSFCPPMRLKIVLRPLPDYIEMIIQCSVGERFEKVMNSNWFNNFQSEVVCLTGYLKEVMRLPECIPVAFNYTPPN